MGISCFRMTQPLGHNESKSQAKISDKLAQSSCSCELEVLILSPFGWLNQTLL